MSSFPLTNSYFFKMVFAPPTSKCELSVAFENAKNWDFHIFQPDADINQIQNEDIFPNKSLGDHRHNFNRLVVSIMFYFPFSWEIILPTRELIFFRGVSIPSTSDLISLSCSIYPSYYIPRSFSCPIIIVIITIIVLANFGV